jgi:hypothetical protein
MSCFQKEAALIVFKANIFLSEFFNWFFNK